MPFAPVEPSIFKRSPHNTPNNKTPSLTVINFLLSWQSVEIDTEATRAAISGIRYIAFIQLLVNKPEFGSSQRQQTETMKASTLDQVVSQWWLGHLEAFQSQDEEYTIDTKVHACRLVKELQLLELNHGMGTMKMKEKVKDSSQSAASALCLLWTEIFIPACLAAKGNDAMVVAKDLLSLMVAVGEQLDITEDLVDLARRAGDAALESVRALGCHLLGRLYQAESLIPRLTDKVISVRAAAIVASGFVLQRQEHTGLLEALLWNVWHETSVPNRVFALQALPASEQVWDHVISRLRDVKEKVRLTAVAVLREKVSTLQQLSSTQLAEIIQSGIGVMGNKASPRFVTYFPSEYLLFHTFAADYLCILTNSLLYSLRCLATKTATIEFVCTHLVKLAKFNVLNLLQQMDVIANEEETEQVVHTIMQATKDSSCNISTLSPPEQRAFQTCISAHLITLKVDNNTYTPEQMLLARVAAIHDPAYLTIVAPDMGVICDVFQQYSEKEGEEALFMGLQILQVATAAGMEEEGSRRRFISLLQAILTLPPEMALPDPFIEASVKALMTLQDGSVDIFNEIIGKLKGSGSDDSHLSTLCTFRVLSILSIVLEEAKVNNSVGDFLRNVSSIVEEAISSSNDLLREAGVSCLAKVGLFSDKDLVIHKFKPLLLTVAFCEDEALTVRSQAMMGLSDWALVFDEIFLASESGSSLGQLLATFLHSENASVAAIAAEATAKLLFAGRLCDSSLIAHLIVLYFDPKCQTPKGATGGEVGSISRMQQWLSLFFPTYCLQSKMARDAVLGSLEDALKYGCTKKSFPIVKVVEYVCEVVAVAEAEVPSDRSNGDNKEANDDEEDSHMALKISLQVAPFILHILVEEEKTGKKSISLTVLRGICKLLGSFDVNGPTTDLIQLRDVMEELAMMLTDPIALRALHELTRDLAQVQDDEGDDDETESGNADATTENVMNPLGEPFIALDKENASSTFESASTKSGVRSSRRVNRSAGLRATTEN